MESDFTSPPDFNCPYATYDELASLWSNYTNSFEWHGDLYLYHSYVCRFASYWSFKDFCATVEGYSVLIFGVLGFLGAFCTALTLHQGQFCQLDFLLFQTVAYLEMIQMADVTSMATLVYFRCELYYTCAIVWAHVATTVANICSDAVDLIVLYLSIERTVACLLPHYFRSLHSLNNYRLIEILCLVFPAIFSMFQAFELRVFYDDEEGRYLEEASPFSQTSFYGGVVLVNMIRFYVTAVFILLATFFSIVGFLSVENRKKKLQSTVKNAQTKLLEQSRQSSQDSATVATGYRRLLSLFTANNKLGAERQDSVASSTIAPSKNSRTGGNSRHRRQADLCSLQLCLAVPVVINLILYATGLTTSNYFFITGKAVFEHNMTFDKAMSEIDLAQSFQYLRTSTNISNVLAHALHFYLYVSFCVKVRSGFASFLRSLIPCFGSRQQKTSIKRRSLIRSSNGFTPNGERTQLMDSGFNSEQLRKSTVHRSLRKNPFDEMSIN